MNLSVVEDQATARTSSEIALQRAENLACLGVTHATELCVGPSLPTLDQAYQTQGIWVWGNDIDPRWTALHQKQYGGRWLPGDALQVNWIGQAVIFAPPLSKGCTGKRADALRISQVEPGYTAFLKEWARRGPYPRVAVLVLPGRSWASPQDRSEYHALMAQAAKYGTVDALAMTAGRRQIRKYIDMYITHE